MRAKGRTALYLLTNSLNVLEYLSSGLVSSIEGFDKYYADTLVLAPGRLPLLTAPPSPGLVNIATPEGGHPVLLEIDPETSAAPAIYSNLHSVDHPVLAPAVTLPLAVVRALIFRSDDDLQEFRARHYDNVPSCDALHQVQPHLFDGQITRETVERALDALHATLPVDFLAEDRRRGAISAVATTSIRGGILEGITLVARLLDHGLHHGSAPTTYPASPEDNIGGGTTAEQWLFDTSLRLLVGMQPNEHWRPRTLPTELRMHLTTADLNDDDRTELDQNLDYVQQVIDNEADFEPFVSGGAVSAPAHALLMVLMRPQLDRLLTWPREQTGSDNRTLLTAVLFAGALRGLKRENIALRNAALDDVTARQAAINLSNGILGSSSISTEVNDEAHGRHSTRVLLADGYPILQVSTNPEGSVGTV